MVITRTVSVLLLVVAAGCAQPDNPANPPSGDRVAKLHAAAECLRQHGVEHFADPVVGANGQVFTDRRPLEDAGQQTDEAAANACQGALNAADWNPRTMPPAPAALVAAGVKAAQCLRAHGLPNYRDPTASSEYTPGHGFGITGDELPPGADKRNPTVQQAFQACRNLLDDENRASTLDQLAGK